MTDKFPKDAFFDKMSLEMSPASDLELGKTYPIYGMITEILEENLESGSITVKIVPEMTLKLTITDEDNLKIIKERAFEPGIFVTKILEKESLEGVPGLYGKCQTVVFGKKQDSGVN